MSRFQAQTNAVLDDELDELRRRLGLRDSQKADLLRELTSLAAWVVRQASEGRVVVAQGKGGAQELVHPALERARRLHDEGAAAPARLELDDDETRRLAEILDRGFEPPPALRESLRRLADPERKATEITWPDAPA